jgi:hypothetical protein
MGESENSQLIARPLVTLTPYLYASPRYLEVSGEPTTPSDLEKHECLSILKGGIWMLRDSHQTVSASVGGRFVLNSVGLIRGLATLDQGCPDAKGNRCR